MFGMGGITGWVLGFGVIAGAIVACGDDGRATSDSASATGSVTSSGSSSPTPTSGVSATGTTAGPGSNSNSESQTTAGTTDSPTSSSVDTSSTGAASATDSGPSTGTTSQASTGGDPCGGEMGGFDFSYLWVANTDQGSISKVDLLTAANSCVYGGSRRVA